MLSNKFFIKIIFVILWCPIGNAVRAKKASIVTPVGETPNNQQWSIPFFDNTFGHLSTGAAMTSPPQPVPAVSTTQPPQPTTIGRTNSINIAPPSVSDSNTIPPGSPQLSSVPLSSPKTIEEPTTVPPIVLVIDPKYMMNYSSGVPTIPSTNIISNNALPASTELPSFVVDPSYFITYSTAIPPTIPTTTTPSTTVVSTPQYITTAIPINASTTTETRSTIITIPVTISTTVISTSTTSSSTTDLSNTLTDPALVSNSPSSIITQTTSQSLSTSTALNNSTSTTSSNPLCTSTSPYRPLGPDCEYKPTDMTNQVNVDSGSTSNNFQIKVPAVIKFDMNITSLPNYLVSLTPVTDNDSDIVEIISSSSSKLVSPLDISSSTNIVNIDLSDAHLNLGWSSSALPTFATVPPPQNKISQLKCTEYYSTGRRTTRRSKVQVFIINGQTSEQKEFPHMAALGYGAKTETDNQWLCGGSLISENYVVTAGHCLTAKSLGPVQFVRLGTTTLQTETLESVDYNVIQRIPHPSYVEGRQYDDIALLQLDRPVEFSEYIAPICLYSSTVPDGVKLKATGWGRTTPTGSTAIELQKVELDAIPSDVCQKAYSIVPKDELPYGILESSQICAGTADGSKDTCQGDSGGPLSLAQDGRLYLVGITSFGIGCAQPGVPGVYTRVSHYIPWLEQTIWEK